MAAAEHAAFGSAGRCLLVAQTQWAFTLRHIDLIFGGTQDFVAEVGIQEGRGVQIDLPAQDPREFLLHFEEGKSGYEFGLEFHEEIDVAVRSKVATQDGTEETESTDVMGPAKLFDSLGIAICARVMESTPCLAVYL